MRAPATGEAATHLPWLSPCAASLVALARLPSTAAWPLIRTDPAAVLLVVRHASAAPSADAPFITAALLQAPALLEDASDRLDAPGSSFVRWDQPERLVIYRSSLTFARLAARIAALCGRCDPDCAWIGGLLAPLGWLALSAVDQTAANASLNDPEWQTDKGGVQQRRWGLDEGSLTRRLCRRWGLPRWLTAIIGHLDLAPPSAASLGAPIELFRTVQLAVTIAQENGVPLGLSVGSSRADNVECLGLTPADMDALAEEARLAQTSEPPAGLEPPDQIPLLRDLLRLACDLRQRREDQTLARLESDVDELHRALREQRNSEEERLRTLKLNSLAEFAAGAGHEINNPLAVISGQAQYLLTHEPDPSRQQALQTIIRQAQRIHQILTELLQFARPPRPELGPVDVAQLVHDVSASLTELADQRRVRLDCVRPPTPCFVQGDSRQLGTALACLLRNAIEAAPADGWAALRLKNGSPESWELAVEDNGSGPPPAQNEHLFDPFYSGRTAGRGRGLGLPTAWQLVRNHGGEVRYEGHDAGITRFVLSLPRMPEPTHNGAAASNGDSSGGNGQIHVHCGP